MAGWRLWVMPRSSRARTPAWVSRKQPKTPSRLPGSPHHEDPEKHLTRGVYQVMALIAPFLEGDARTHLNYLKANYLE
jgi:hypothetical protein